MAIANILIPGSTYHDDIQRYLFSICGLAGIVSRTDGNFCKRASRGGGICAAAHAVARRCVVRRRPRGGDGPRCFTQQARHVQHRELERMAEQIGKEKARPRISCTPHASAWVGEGVSLSTNLGPAPSSLEYDEVGQMRFDANFGETGLQI
jgi:hypothetical protein